MTDRNGSPGPQYRYDQHGRLVARIITARGWTITQVPRGNEWWNIEITRKTGP